MSRRRFQSAGRRLVGIVSFGVLALGFAVGGEAADSGEVTLSLTVETPPVRSILIETLGSTAYGRCGFGNTPGTLLSLPFPRGRCWTPDNAIRLTVGDVASRVRVRTTSMSAPGAVSWAPTSSPPGPDQFEVSLRTEVFGNYAAFVPLEATDRCDFGDFYGALQFEPCELEPAHAVRYPRFDIVGPTVASTPIAGPWSHTVVWTVSP